MAKYQVDVNNKTYEVEAPDEATAWEWANHTAQNEEAEAPQAPILEEAEERDLGDKLIGAGETALALGTGSTIGLGGQIYGTLKGFASELLGGEFGTPEAAKRIEEMANRYASEFTYEPKTPEGREYTKEVAETLAPLEGLAPIAGQLGAATQALKPIAQTKIPSMPKKAPQQLGMKELAETTKRATESGLRQKKAKEVLTKQAMPDKETLESAKRLEIDEYLQPDHVTTNQAFRELTQAAKSVPGSELRSQELKVFGQVAKKADDIINELGGTQDLSKLDIDVKSRLSKIQDDLYKQSETLYKQLSEKIPQKADVEANNVLNWIENQADELGGVNKLSPLEKKVYRTLSADENGNMPTYALLDRVRKDLTAARVKKEGAFKDANTGLIKKIESELLKDQNIVADTYGAGELFKDARNSVRIRKGVEDDMTALFGRNLDRSIVGDLSTSMTKISKGDASNLAKLVKSIPEEMRGEVVASGLNTAFGKNARNNNINFNSYAKWYENLRENKQAYNALMTNLPKEARQRLNDLYKVSNGISKATKERITTGRIQAVKDEIQGVDSLMSNIYDVAKKSIGAEAITSAAGLPGAGVSASIASALTKGKTNILKAADELIASPEFLEAAKRVGTKGQDQAIKKLARSKKMTKFMRTADIATSPEAWILQSLIQKEENGK